MNDKGKQPSATIEKINEQPDAVRSFMTQHASNTFEPDRDDVPGSLSPEQLPETAAADTAAAEPTATEATPTAAPSPELTAAEEPQAKGKPEKPAQTKPAAEKPAEVKPQVEASKPSYASDEKIPLVEGSEPWTREQIVLGLQERAKLQPLAGEASRFQKLFGYDAERAEKEWKPILEILSADVAKRQFLDTAIHADAGLLQYLSDSAAYYKEKMGDETPAGKGAPKGPDQPPADPRLDQALAFIQKQTERTAIERANREWNQVLGEFQFIGKDARLMEGLKSVANVLYNADRAAGKDDLDCRGLLDALELNRPMYEAMKIGQAATTTTETSVDPTKGAEALLTGSGPAPSVGTRGHVKEYTGNPDEAVAAFLEKYPGQ